MDGDAHSCTLHKLLFLIVLKVKVVGNPLPYRSQNGMVVKEAGPTNGYELANHVAWTRHPVPLCDGDASTPPRLPTQCLHSKTSRSMSTLHHDLPLNAYTPIRLPAHCLYNTTAALDLSLPTHHTEGASALTMHPT
eukprot:1152872-Pelagomonas_calceolata.AAC.6